MSNLDFTKEWPFTVTEQTMADGWTWYRVEGVQDMTLKQLAEVYNTPRGGFELVTVDEGEEADSYPESFVNMLEEVTANGRAIGLFPEPKTQPKPEKGFYTAEIRIHLAHKVRGADILERCDTLESRLKAAIENLDHPEGLLGAFVSVKEPTPL